MTSIDIIGNGPSQSIWKPSDTKWVQCNLPHHVHEPTVMIIVDIQPITWMKNNDYKTDAEILVTERAFRVAEQYKLKLNFKQVWRNPNSEGFMNSGQAAVLHFANDYDSIHLWGFDSMTNGKTESCMDKMVHRVRRQNLNQSWDRYWIDIFKKHHNKQFIVHGKTTSGLITDYGSNVKYQQTML